MNLRAGGIAVANDAHRLLRYAMNVGLFPNVAAATHSQQQQLGEGVHHGNTYTVQPSRDFVGVVVELTAGVQHGHDHFGSRNAFFLVHIHRNTATVVTHGDRFIRMDDDADVVAMTGQRFVDRVVDHLEHHVVQTAAIVGVADVHTGTLAYGIQAFQHLDTVGVVRLVFAHALLPVVLGLGDLAMFHVEHGNWRIRAPALPQQFVVYTGNEYLAV